MRGIWVDAFHPGFKTPEETSAMVAKARDSNFNAIFVQMRKRGDVYYNSSIEPKAVDISPGYDALADIVTKAHAAGLEVHAWVAVYEVQYESKWTPPQPGHVCLTHPEWLMKDDKGRTKFPGDKIYLDPGVPEVRAYLVSIVEELVRRHDIDGIHLDIARYPSETAGYNETSVALFDQETSRTGSPDKDDQAWAAWRTAQVTRLVQEVYQRATSIRPQVKVSAAVFANRTDAAGNRFQDWEAWLRAGILDFAVPMNFAADNRVVQAKCEETSSLLSTGRAIYMGLGGYKVSAAKALQQVAMAREAGFGGIVVYSYAYCSKPKGETPSFMDQLKTGPFSQPAAIPTMSWK